MAEYLILDRWRLWDDAMTGGPHLVGNEMIFCFSVLENDIFQLVCCVKCEYWTEGGKG